MVTNVVVNHNHSRSIIWLCYHALHGLFFLGGGGGGGGTHTQTHTLLYLWGMLGVSQKDICQSHIFHVCKCFILYAPRGGQKKKL